MQVVDIPVLPHVRSFLLALYGPEPIHANENNLLGQEIENILHSYLQDSLFPERIVGTTVKMHISVRLFPYYSRFRQAFVLGCYFEKTFHSMLFIYVSAQVEAGIRQEKAIRNFYQRYNIDADSYDVTAARMSLARMKKKLNQFKIV